MPSVRASSNQFLSDKKVLLGQNWNGPGGTTDTVWRWPERRGRKSFGDDEGGGGVSSSVKREGGKRDDDDGDEERSGGKSMEESGGWEVAVKKERVRLHINIKELKMITFPLEFFRTYFPLLVLVGVFIVNIIKWHVLCHLLIVIHWFVHI